MVPKHDVAAEQAVLGAILLSPRPVMKALLQQGLRAEHFYRDTHRRIYALMTGMDARGGDVDEATVRFEVERTGLDVQKTTEALLTCVGSVPAVGNVRRYAERVIEHADWRRRTEAAQEILAAAETENIERFAAAQQMLAGASTTRSNDTYDPDRLANLLGDYFSRKDAQKAIPLPLHRLNNALSGGLWGGEVMIVGGHTSHGKSVWGDQCLDHAAKKGFRCHAYLTEMSALTRGLRLISRRTGIPFGKLRQRTNLTERDVKKILDELEHLPYGYTIASAWDIEDVARDALHSRWDLMLVDLLHGFTYNDERGLDRLSKTVQRTAIQSTTLEGFDGTAVIAVAHLGRGAGGQGVKRGRPGLRDLKGGSSLEQDADFVSFVWLEDDDRGVPGTTGEIWVAKGRNGAPEIVKVELNPVRFQFEPVDS